ncbi:MAG: hypothetical protein ACQESA_01250 [Patescibacteria group bacterium]
MLLRWKNTIFITLLIASVLLALFSFMALKEGEDLSYARESALANLSLSSSSNVAPEYKEEIKRCERMDLYDRFNTMQPADMSKDELREAIEVAKECASYFPEKRRFSYKKMKNDLEDMENIIDSSLYVFNGSNKDDLVSVWYSIEDNLKTQSDTFEDLNQIQSKYWRVELSFREGELTPEERENKFGDLNREARHKMEQMNEAQEGLRELKKKEQRIWRSVAN